jgi:hypothetical protein
MSLDEMKREGAIIPAPVQPAPLPARCTIGNTGLHKLFIGHGKR